MAVLAASLALLLAVAVWVPGSASAGELAYKGCITSSPGLGPSGSGACGSRIRSPALRLIDAMASSPDGTSVFTATGFACEGLDNERCEVPGAVGEFDRDSTTGALSYDGCFSRSNACAQSADLGDIDGMAVSPDNKSLYVTSGLVCDDSGCYGANALAHFQRGPTTGTLSYRGCVTGDETAGVPGSAACTEIPSATPEGANSGLAEPTSVAVSPDGKSVYVASVLDTSIATFSRDPDTGSLEYEGCITGSEGTGPSGSGACAEIPSATDYGYRSGLYVLGSVAVSPDGKTVYTSADVDAAVARFERDPSTGALTYADCITGVVALGPSGNGACSAIPDAKPRGSMLRGVGPLTLSPDGTSLYAGGISRASVVRFDRDTSNGALTFVDCLTGDKRFPSVCRPVPSPALDSLRSLAMSPDGTSLYTAGGAVVTRFARGLGSGAVKLSSCVSGYLPRRPRNPVCLPSRHATSSGYDSGLGGIGSLALACSQAGACGVPLSRESVYAGAFGDDSVATLAVAPQTRIEDGPRGRTRRRGVVFEFSASAGSSFRCKVTGKNVKKRLRRWRHCGLPWHNYAGGMHYRYLPRGKKVFKVKATDRANTTDPTPAKRRFRVR